MKYIVLHIRRLRISIKKRGAHIIMNIIEVYNNIIGTSRKLTYFTAVDTIVRSLLDSVDLR